MKISVAPRRGFLTLASAVALTTGALVTFGGTPQVRAEGAGGVQKFQETGAPQSFQVPATVTEVTVDLGGANGDNAAAAGSGFGGSATSTIDVTPGDTLQINVGGTADIDGGYNGGGPGDPMLEGGGANGGGGATDLRTGSCAAELACGDAARVLVAGGGGGTGSAVTIRNNELLFAFGGNGAAPSGDSGTDGSVPGSGGAGGGQDAPGAGGVNSGTNGDVAGSPGDGANGGAAGFGGGGGDLAAESGAPGGAGGGGSSHGPAGSNLVDGGGLDLADGNGNGSAGVYWMTSDTTTYLPNTQFTLTANLPPNTGGTETFTDGTTVLCANVPVAADGTATCQASVSTTGTNTFVATFTAPVQQPEVVRRDFKPQIGYTASSARFNGTAQAISVTVGTTSTPAPTPTATPTGSVAGVTATPTGSVQGVSTPSTGAREAGAPGTSLPLGLLLLLSGATLLAAAARPKHGTLIREDESVTN
jgi:hypothetical protein